MTQRALLAFALTFTFAFAACQRESTPATSTSPTQTAAIETDTASATHPASPGGTALVPDVAAGTTVLVVLEDNSLGLPGQPIPPGAAILNVENRGTQVHNLFVEGEGVNRAAGDNIEAGKSAVVDVVFKAGAYTFYCPIPNHRENGEQAAVTIQ
jgi:uncharacterized cupredoxin-like copper-binding protein